MTMPRKRDAQALKPDAAKPLYIQVKEFVLEQILSGKWSDGRVPSENSLVGQLNVSRMTVHRALREMKSEGVFVRVPGRGTFLSKEKPRSTLLETQDIAEEVKARRSDYRCQVHVLEEVVADRDVAVALEVRVHEPVFHSVIVHYENDAPVQLEERWIKQSIAPGYLNQDFTRRTPHSYLTLCAEITEVEHTLHAIRPDRRAMGLLRMERAEPCLLLARRTWSHGIAATRSFFTYPGDRYSLGGRYRVMGEPGNPILASMAAPLVYQPDSGRRAKRKVRR